MSPLAPSRLSDRGARRVRAVAVALLTALAVLLPAAALPSTASADARGAARALERVRDDPARLYAFLRAMPKGADLHMHLSGSIYAETLVRFGAENGACVDLTTFVASAGPCVAGERPIADALADNGFQSRLVGAWSMKGFPAGRSGHDHFFATFGRFGATLDGRVGEGLATVTRRARAQNVQYLELMMTPRGWEVAEVARRVRFTRDFAALRQRLLDAGLREILPRARADLDAIMAQKRRHDPSDDPVVRFIAQVARTGEPTRAFAQLLLAFELMREDPRWVGVNLVQPEDDVMALRNYRLQMRMIRHLRSVYPDGRVTLHAGELAPGLVPPADLRFHIRAAVTVAGADRIGHGTSIRWERNPRALARTMARRGVLVEVPLTSNAQILGVAGRDHPLRFYLRHRVPVALATDDEGVSRTSLTEQYVQAVRDHGLGYRALKRIATNALRHAFADPATKRRLLRDQRRRFHRFEARYPARGRRVAR